MTPKQESLYWCEWSAARAALRELGHKLPDNDLRHWLTAQALGEDKPHRAFNNLDFDRFLGVARGSPSPTFGIPPMLCSRSSTTRRKSKDEPLRRRATRRLK